MVLLEKTRDVLRLFERLACEHHAWLMRVHAAILFPGHAALPPCEPDAPLPQLCMSACGQSDVLSPLVSLRAAMHGQAQELSGKAARGGRVDPLDYQRFMAAVEAYQREARRVECHFRRTLAETDPLTGIHNRQGMMRDLRREWTRALRTGQPTCLALADLDLFKAINDTWGHCTGDRVLSAAARFFQRRLRPYDSVYRYGGEEFLFCLPDTTADTAAQVLDRLRRHLAKLPIQSECGQKVAVTCSIGVAQMVPGRSVHEAIAAADLALYTAKDAGRNRVCIAPDPGPVPSPEAIVARLHPLRGAVRV